MASWQDLVQTSTLGLNRMRLSSDLEQEWLREIKWTENPEERLLELAGTFALARQAGYDPPQIESEK